MCHCNGTVIYANDDGTKSVSKSVTEEITCSTDVFGDPAPGQRKSCTCLPGMGLQ